MPVFLLFAALTLYPQSPSPDIEALLKTAQASYRKADYGTARKSLEDAWAAADTLPQTDPKRYEILKQLAEVLGSAGDNDAAENYIELAINWRENAIGRDDPLIAGELIELATNCERRKDFDRAIAILHQVITLHAKAGGRESADVADDYSRIALVEAARDKPDDAIAPLETAIGIRERLLGPDSTGLLSELDRLGALQVATHVYPDAESTFRRALAIRERVVGSKSPDLLTTLDGLAYSLFGEKKYDDAEPFYKRLLDLWIMVGNLPMIADTQEKIAVFYREQQKWQQGTESADAAISLRAMVSATGLTTEATAWLGHGNKVHAIELYKKALSMLDPDRRDQDGIRGQIEHVLSELDTAPAPKANKTTQAKKKQL